jgi:hypothetical protein
VAGKPRSLHRPSTYPTNSRWNHLPGTRLGAWVLQPSR